MDRDDIFRARAQVKQNALAIARQRTEIEKHRQVEVAKLDESYEPELYWDIFIGELRMLGYDVLEVIQGPVGAVGMQGDPGCAHVKGLCFEHTVEGADGERVPVPKMGCPRCAGVPDPAPDEHLIGEQEKP